MQSFIFKFQLISDIHLPFYCQFSFTVQRISPDTSSKVQLQIVFHNDSAYNLHFANSSGRQVQVKERDEIKEMLAELIPQHRQMANKDLEEKNRSILIFPQVVSNLLLAIMPNL